MDIKAQRLEILRQVENGEMLPDEAARWLTALEKVNGSTRSSTEVQLESSSGATQPLIQDPVMEPVRASTSNSGADKVDGEHHSEPVGVEPMTVVFVEPEAVKVEEPQPEPVWKGAVPADADQTTHPDFEPPSSARPGPADELRPLDALWRGWWMLVFIPGLLLVIAAVDSMSRGFITAGLSWGFWLSFIPFGLGVLLMWLGWEVRMARWLYIHIQQKPGAHPREIRLSFPLPTGLLNWGLRRFGRFDARFHGQDVATLFEEIDQSVTTDSPIHILVDEGNGEQVEVWIDGPGK